MNEAESASVRWMKPVSQSHVPHNQNTEKNTGFTCDSLSASQLKACSCLIVAYINSDKAIFHFNLYFLFLCKYVSIKPVYTSRYRKPVCIRFRCLVSLSANKSPHFPSQSRNQHRLVLVISTVTSSKTIFHLIGLLCLWHHWWSTFAMFQTEN